MVMDKKLLTDMGQHLSDTTIHVTSAEKASWNLAIAFAIALG